MALASSSFPWKGLCSFPCSIACLQRDLTFFCSKWMQHYGISEVDDSFFRSSGLFSSLHLVFFDTASIYFEEKAERRSVNEDISRARLVAIHANKLLLLGNALFAPPMREVSLLLMAQAPDHEDGINRSRSVQRAAQQVRQRSGQTLSPGDCQIRSVVIPELSQSKNRLAVVRLTYCNLWCALRDSNSRPSDP